MSEPAPGWRPGQYGHGVLHVADNGEDRIVTWPADGPAPPVPRPIARFVVTPSGAVAITAPNPFAGTELADRLDALLEPPLRFHRRQASRPVLARTPTLAEAVEHLRAGDNRT